MNGWATVNSIQDFCLFAPHELGPVSQIGSMERTVVAWCLRPGYGTRIIPQGTITGAHFVQTPDYVQVTGIGDLTKLNFPKGDKTTTLELDPHGDDGRGEQVCLACARIYSRFGRQSHRRSRILQCVWRWYVGDA